MNERIDHHDTKQRTTPNLKREKKKCEQNHVHSEGRSK